MPEKGKITIRRGENDRNEKKNTNRAISVIKDQTQMADVKIILESLSIWAHSSATTMQKKNEKRNTLMELRWAIKQKCNSLREM